MKIHHLIDIEQHEIEKMINDGRKIAWKNLGYTVLKDCLGQYLIIYKSTGDTVGLQSAFWNGEIKSSAFFEIEE